jgi:predicted RNA polymerase sigma factor
MSLEKEFESYQPFFAAKVDFYQRLGNLHISRKSYFKAIKLSGDEKEKEFLLKK